jgi:hypothetical protein
MWIDIGTLVLTTILSVTGTGLPQLNAAPISTPMMSCLSQSLDSCEQSESCALFVEPSGAEVCSVACSAHTVETCALDSHCAVFDGVCDYAAESPAAC